MRKKSCNSLLRLINGIAVPVCIRDFPHDPAGNAEGDHPCWDVFRNHAACPDDGVVPDGNAGQNGGTRSDPHVISNADRLCHLHACLALFRINRMLRGGDAAVGSDEHMIAKPNLGPVRDHRP